MYYSHSSMTRSLLPCHGYSDVVALGGVDLIDTKNVHVIMKVIAVNIFNRNLHCLVRCIPGEDN